MLQSGKERGAGMNDSKRTLICPACGKEMEKVYIEDAGFYLDICSKGCGGIYFDARELTAFDEGDEDIKPVENALAEGDYAPVNEDKLRVCPSCGTNMVKHSTSVKNKVVIDECYLCGGKFFDYNELQALRAEYETEEDRSADAHETLHSCLVLKRKNGTLFKLNDIKNDLLPRLYLTAV